MVCRVLSFASALAFSVAASAAATSGDFNVLSQNVAGLPPIFNGNDIPGSKEDDSREIGRRFAKYDWDVIHVQEDFNYHAYIYETDAHPYRTATSGGVPFGSGLNTLSNFPFSMYTRTKWNTCSIGSGDCLTPKGFTFMRVQVTDGAYIDFYNVHTDAGSESGDITARAANLKQVSDYINVNSVGNAVIVYGDTNSRYTRVGDGITIFKTQNSLTDAWVQLVRGGVNPTVETLCSNPSTTNYCETVDKAFYRGSKLLNLQATYFGYESSKFLQADGSVLSDHNGITVNFTWSASNSFRQSNFFGGSGGTWYNDITTLPSSPKVSSITFRGASRVDSVSVQLSSGQTFTHGGTGGAAYTLTLAAGEYWTKARLCQGEHNSGTRIFYILATTSTGRTLATGATTGTCVDFAAPAGWQIVGSTGLVGTEVDQLSFIYAPQ